MANTSKKEIMGLTHMTKESIVKSCKKNKLYVTPHLNDVLYLHYSGYQEIKSLEEYTGLKCLWLECNAFSEIQGLENQTKLRCLFLQNNLIKRISNLESCKELDTLNLNFNMISKIENCGSDILPVLTTLQISNNYLRTAESIEQLKFCSKLSVLDISNNRIEDILIVKVLSQMPELKVLTMTGNPVVNSIPTYRKTLIIECKSLTYLDTRPVFPKDRACAEAWKRGGYDEERRENYRWQREERRKIRRSVNATLRLRRRGAGEPAPETINTSSEEDDEMERSSAPPAMPNDIIDDTWESIERNAENRQIMNEIGGQSDHSDKCSDCNKSTCECSSSAASSSSSDESTDENKALKEKINISIHKNPPIEDIRAATSQDLPSNVLSHLPRGKLVEEIEAPLIQEIVASPPNSSDNSSPCTPTDDNPIIIKESMEVLNTPIISTSPVKVKKLIEEITEAIVDDKAHIRKAEQIKEVNINVKKIIQAIERPSDPDVCKKLQDEVKEHNASDNNSPEDSITKDGENKKEAITLYQAQEIDCSPKIRKIVKEDVSAKHLKSSAISNDVRDANYGRKLLIQDICQEKKGDCKQPVIHPKSPTSDEGSESKDVIEVCGKSIFERICMFEEKDKKSSNDYGKFPKPKKNRPTVSLEEQNPVVKKKLIEEISIDDQVKAIFAEHEAFINKNVLNNSQSSPDTSTECEESFGENQQIENNATLYLSVINIEDSLVEDVVDAPETKVALNFGEDDFTDTSFYSVVETSDRESLDSSSVMEYATSIACYTDQLTKENRKYEELDELIVCSTPQAKGENIKEMNESSLLTDESGSTELVVPDLTESLLTEDETEAISATECEKDMLNMKMELNDSNDSLLNSTDADIVSESSNQISNALVDSLILYENGNLNNSLFPTGPIKLPPTNDFRDSHCCLVDMNLPCNKLKLETKMSRSRLASVNELDETTDSDVIELTNENSILMESKLLLSPTVPVVIPMQEFKCHKLSPSSDASSESVVELNNSKDLFLVESDNQMQDVSCNATKGGDTTIASDSRNEIPSNNFTGTSSEESTNHFNDTESSTEITHLGASSMMVEYDSSEQCLNTTFTANLCEVEYLVEKSTVYSIDAKYDNDVAFMEIIDPLPDTLSTEIITENENIKIELKETPADAVVSNKNEDIKELISASQAIAADNKYLHEISEPFASGLPNLVNICGIPDSMLGKDNFSTYRTPPPVLDDSSYDFDCQDDEDIPLKVVVPDEKYQKINDLFNNLKIQNCVEDSSATTTDNTNNFSYSLVVNEERNRSYIQDLLVRRSYDRKQAERDDRQETEDILRNLKTVKCREQFERENKIDEDEMEEEEVETQTEIVEEKRPTYDEFVQGYSSFLETAMKPRETKSNLSDEVPEKTKIIYPGVIHTIMNENSFENLEPRKCEPEAEAKHASEVLTNKIESFIQKLQTDNNELEEKLNNLEESSVLTAEKVKANHDTLENMGSGASGWKSSQLCFEDLNRSKIDVDWFKKLSQECDKELLKEKEEEEEDGEDEDEPEMQDNLYELNTDQKSIIDNEKYKKIIADIDESLHNDITKILIDAQLDFNLIEEMEKEDDEVDLEKIEMYRKQLKGSLSEEKRTEYDTENKYWTKFNGNIEEFKENIDLDSHPAIIALNNLMTEMNEEQPQAEMNEEANIDVIKQICESNDYQCMKEARLAWSAFDKQRNEIEQNMKGTRFCTSQLEESVDEQFFDCCDTESSAIESASGANESMSTTSQTLNVGVGEPMPKEFWNAIEKKHLATLHAAFDNQMIDLDNAFGKLLTGEMAIEPTDNTDEVDPESAVDAIPN